MDRMPLDVPPCMLNFEPMNAALVRCVLAYMTVRWFHHFTCFAFNFHWMEEWKPIYETQKNNVFPRVDIFSVVKAAGAKTLIRETKCYSRKTISAFNILGKWIESHNL